jgi:transposase InsO family protein
MILGFIDEAVAAGARFEVACETIGLAARTVQRWRDDPDADDERAGPVSKPRHALSAEERELIVAIATSRRYRNHSVRQIVPLLADEGVYVASESSFYRVLHEEELMAHRNPARPASHAKPKALCATGPCQVWSWDITYLRAATRGTFYYLYLVLDVWSRKVVAWAVHEEECAELASALVTKACTEERVDRGALTLHSDNGGPMKGATMLATLQRLGIAASFSRPRVSDDNAICEAIFRTLKYRPGYPRKPFASLEAARAWVAGFVDWYNNEHLHSSIKYVTPDDRHEGRDGAILAARHALYREAKSSTPRRWTGDTRDWARIETVTLNPQGKDQAA